MSRHPHARAVTRYIAHITDRAGIPHRIALVAFCLSDARREALLVGRSRYGRNFSFCVRAAA